MYLSKRINGYYYIYYKDKYGKHQGISTKSKLKSDALEFLTNFKSELKKKEHQKVIPILLDAFRKEFLKHSEAIHSPKTTKTFITTFRYLQEFLGNISLAEIKEKDIKAYIDNRITSASVYQARKDLINLSSCFNWSISEGYILTNPCKNVPKVKVPQKMPVFFSRKEFNKLLEVIDNQDLKDLITFAVNTGCRQMELLTAEWNQVNFEQSLLILDNHNHVTKSKKIRSIPLNKTAVEVLLRRKELNSYNQNIFIHKGRALIPKRVQNNFRIYIKVAGLNPKLNFHSLRHTFASWLVQMGVSIYEVSKLLGHSNIKTTEIYSHLRTEDLMKSVNLLNN
ncbi:MAG: site-specific integrase [Bacteroidetes bacterium]|nr:site-specific integrase [Bacteroidota bacterium]